MLFLYLQLLVIRSATVVAAENSSPTSISQGIFRMGSSKDVVFTQGLLLETAAASIADCGVLCLDLGQCVSFTFRKIHHTFLDGSCRLYGQFHSTNDEKIAQLGASYYGPDTTEFRCVEKGYFLKEGRCIQLITQSMSYQDAKQRCQTMANGHLFHAKTLADIQFVLQVVRSNGFVGAWLGADNLLAGDGFQWTDGSSLPLNSSLWSRDEPTNGRGFCVAMHSAYQKLDDIPCYRDDLQAVCQRD